MKIWLNNLKVGDNFYHIIFGDVYYCEVTELCNDVKFKMPRIKFKILNNGLLELNSDFKDKEQSDLGNQYVFDNDEECKDYLIEKLEEKETNYISELDIYDDKIRDLKNKIKAINKQIKKWKNFVKND